VTSRHRRLGGAGLSGKDKRYLMSWVVARLIGDRTGLSAMGKHGA